PQTTMSFSLLVVTAVPAPANDHGTEQSPPLHAAPHTTLRDRPHDTALQDGSLHVMPQAPPLDASTPQTTGWCAGVVTEPHVTPVAHAFAEGRGIPPRRS